MKKMENKTKKLLISTIDNIIADKNMKTNNRNEVGNLFSSFLEIYNKRNFVPVDVVSQRSFYKNASEDFTRYMKEVYKNGE